MDEQKVIAQLIAEGYHDAAAYDEAPGTGQAEHTHPDEAKIVIISGETEISFGSARRTLRPGDVLVIPKDTFHASKAGHEGARYVLGEKPGTDSAIQFFHDHYSCLSNFSAHKITYRGEVYVTSEHAYQAAKFADVTIRAKVKEAPSAFLAHEFGQSKEGRTPDFDKVAIMKEIMRAKMEQHEEVRWALLSTGHQPIEKNHPSDYFWGIGADGSGQNVMGKIWMELRSEML